VAGLVPPTTAEAGELTTAARADPTARARRTIAAMDDQALIARYV